MWPAVLRGDTWALIKYGPSKESHAIFRIMKGYKFLSCYSPHHEGVQVSLMLFSASWRGTSFSHAILRIMRGYKFLSCYSPHHEGLQVFLMLFSASWRGTGFSHAILSIMKGNKFLSCYSPHHEGVQGSRSVQGQNGADPANLTLCICPRALKTFCIRWISLNSQVDHQSSSTFFCYLLWMLYYKTASTAWYNSN